MLNWLRDDVVLYGLFRMGFGTGDFRRSKLVFLRWSGEATPAIERGKGNAVEEAMQEVLSSHTHVTILSTIHTPGRHSLPATYHNP
jgi:hypothetical protein